MHKGLNWIDLESPSKEEVDYILDEHNIPVFIREDIILKTTDDKIRLEQGYIYVHLNIQQVKDDKNENNKLVFVANDNFVIVIHTKPMQALREFGKEMELDIVTEEKFGTNNKLLFAHMLKNLYIDSQKQLTKKEIEVDDFKKQVINLTKKYKSIIFYLVLSLLIVIILIFICL
jgi:Mg2+ and Co2+ transporter CorA